jgi:hypothetical protein
METAPAAAVAARPLASRVCRRWRLSLLSGATLATLADVLNSLRALNKFRFIHVLPGIAVVYGDSERGSSVLRAAEGALAPLGLRCALTEFRDDDAGGGLRWGSLPRTGRPLKSPLGM